MFRSFRDRDTERLFDREPVRKWSPALQRTALRKLRMLASAETLDDLRVPPGIGWNDCGEIVLASSAFE